MLLWTFVATASAQDAGPGFKWPNSLVGVTGGTPMLLGLRGEQWLSDDVTGELGVGVTTVDDLELAFDWAFRWRPDFACLGCGTKALVTIGVGPGGTVIPPAGFDGPWVYSVGLDLGVNGVAWVGPAIGLTAGVRVGGGAQVEGTEFDDLAGTGWVMGSAGLAF